MAPRAVSGGHRALGRGRQGLWGDEQVAQLPAARIDAREERQRLLALRLGREVAAVFGNVTDEEHRVVEHHEVLFAGMARVTRELFPGHVE